MSLYIHNPLKYDVFQTSFSIQNNRTYVYNTEFVDHLPIQLDSNMLDDVVSHGIQLVRCMDYVRRMDFDSVD